MKSSLRSVFSVSRFASRCRVGAVLAFLTSSLVLWAQNGRSGAERWPTEAIDAESSLPPPAVFARNTLDSDGEIEGPAWAGKADTTRLGTTARIKGHLWLAPSAVVRRPGEILPARPAGAVTARPQRADLANRVQGEEKSLPALPELPKLPRSEPISRGRDVTVDDRPASVAWSEVRHVSLRKRGETALPPGSYGDLDVERGALVLGTARKGPKSVYTFRSLTVRPGAELKVLGPVTVVLNADSTLGGDAGAGANPEWLDLRLAAGSLTIGAGVRIQGSVLASTGGVQIGARAQIAGTVAGETVALGREARVAPPLPKLVPSAQQPFLPKALRVQSRLPALIERHRHDYHITASYVDDVPHLLLAEGKRAGNAKVDQQNDRLALLGALADTLVDTGFNRATVTVVRYRAERTRPDDVTNYAFTRSEFENALRFAGGRNNSQDNIRKLRDDPLRLNIFVNWCEQLAAAKQQAGR